jgi:hypothetical protein
MWAEGVRMGEWGEGGYKVKGGQLLLGKGPEWMGIRHHEQDIGLLSKRDSCKGGLGPNN